MSESEIEAQIADLQTRIAFQEDTIHSLNQVIVKQDSDICSLQEQVKALYSKLDDLTYEVGGQQGAGAENQERPPHY